MTHKVLNILPFLPWPLATGGHNGIFHSIDALKDDVEFYVLFPFEKNQKDIDYLSQKWPNVTLIPYHRKSRFSRKWHLKVKSLFFKLQRLLYPGFNESIEWGFELDSERYEDSYLQCISDSIKNYDIDTVIVEFPSMMSLVLWLPDNVKKIFVHHELRYVKNELILSSKKIKNQYYEFYKRKSKNEEIALLNKYDQVITFSAIDRDKLISDGVVVPCDASFLIVDQLPKQKFIPATNKVTFLGSGGHMPNAVGLRWFMDAEWNKIIQSHPDIHLVIVGRWSETLQKEFLHKYRNVEFKGFVENLYDELAGSVMIVPLTIGSGIRIKILECTSLCVPFVTTSIGVEGLPFKDRENCEIKDSTDDFADSLLKLLNHQSLQKQYAESSYELVHTQYSKEAFRRSRLQLLNR